MTCGDVVLMSLLRSKLGLLVLPQARGCGGGGSLATAGQKSSLLELRLEPRNRLVHIPLGMGDTPGKTRFRCAYDLSRCPAVIRSLLVLSDLRAVPLSCLWFVISLQQQLHLCFCTAGHCCRYNVVWPGVLGWLRSVCFQLSPCAACWFGPHSSFGACRLRPF